MQALRTVKAALKSAEPGIRKDFFENSRWLILSAIYLRLRPQLGDALSLTPAEVAALTQAAQDGCKSTAFFGTAN